MRGSIAAICVFASSTVALAVPKQLVHSGRLLDANGSPMSGERELVFTLWDAPRETFEDDIGNALWTETVSVNLQSGNYTALLGTDASWGSLEAALDTSEPTYFSVTVADEELLPRRSLSSVPYAAFAAKAAVATDLVGGRVEASSIAVGDRTIIDSQGNWKGEPLPDQDTLGEISCKVGDEPVLSESGWTCTPRYGTEAALADLVEYAANEPLVLAANSSVGGQVISTGDHYTDDDAIAAMGVAAIDNELRHVRYTDVEARIAVTEQEISNITVQSLEVTSQADLTNADIAGSVQFRAFEGACDASQAGRIRFVDQFASVEACDGRRWVALYRPRADGSTPEQAAKSCQDILEDGFSTGDGAYYLKPSRGDGETYSAYCDMTTQGGGWTLVAKLDGQSSVMNSNNTTQWRDLEYIGNTDRLVAENALGPAYEHVAFTDVMIRSLEAPEKNLGWRHARPLTSMYDVVRAGAPVSDGGKLFGAVQNLDYSGDPQYHNDCADLRFGFFGFDWSYRGHTAGHARTTGHVGGVVAASRFEASNTLQNCVSDFGFGGGYYTMASPDDQFNINAHWWGAGNDHTHGFNAHGLFVR